MAITYQDGLKNFEKSEEMKRLAMGSYEKPLGKDYDEDTKNCARNFAILLALELEDKMKTRELAKRYPHINTATRS